MTNIALIVLDTLREDTFGRHFDWLPGQRFSNAFSTSHWTVPAHASLFTGKYASEVGVYAGSQRLDCDEPVLAEQLSDAGYTTRALSTNVNISSVFEFDRGFDQFNSLGRHNRQLRQVSDPNLFDWSEYGGAGAGSKEYARALWDFIHSDCAMLRSLRYGINLKFKPSERFWGEPTTNDMGARQILERVRGTDFGDKEFLFVNLMETHGPYKIPDPYTSVEKFEAPENPVGKVENDLDLEKLQIRYDDAAVYLSEVYRDIFDELVEDFDIIITVSDHGELLGEHGYCYHAAGIYPELTRVPLVVYPGNGGDLVEAPVSLFDIHRTVLAAAGEDTENSRGVDLCNGNLSDRQVLTEYHGLPHPDRTLDALREWLESDDELNRYQEWRRGICLESGYYSYETIEGFVEDETTPTVDPEAALAEAVADLDVPDIDVDRSMEIDDAVRKELEHLGYI